jgi:hypothetical protein
MMKLRAGGLVPYGQQHDEVARTTFSLKTNCLVPEYLTYRLKAPYLLAMFLCFYLARNLVAKIQVVQGDQLVLGVVLPVEILAKHDNFFEAAEIGYPGDIANSHVEAELIDGRSPIRQSSGRLKGNDLVDHVSPEINVD